MNRTPADNGSRERPLMYVAALLLGMANLLLIVAVYLAFF